MKNIPLLIASVVGTFALIALIAILFSRNGAVESPALSAEVTSSLAQDARHVKGVESAAVTIVEFSDFQCPACAASQTILKAVMAKYPDDLRLIYRHFPLDSIHPYARTVATASELAGQNNKFWEFHDRVFDAQSTWSSLKSRAELITYLESVLAELGIDNSNLADKIQDTSLTNPVAADVQLGNQARVQATPTFFVNGKPVTASELLPTVSALVDGS